MVALGSGMVDCSRIGDRWRILDWSMASTTLPSRSVPANRALQLRLLRAAEVSTTDINQLLKAAALRAFPAEQVAALHGQDWQDFLLKTCKNLPTDGFADLDLLYAAHPPAATEPLLLMSEYWVRRHEVSDA